jgi:hypothetical protein
MRYGLQAICSLAATAAVLCGLGCTKEVRPDRPRDIGVFYFTLSSWKGMTFHVNIQDTEVLYRCSLYGDDALTRWATFSLSDQKAREFFADIAALAVLDWDAEYSTPQLDGEGWTVTGNFNQRHVQSVGFNAQPPDLPALVQLVSRLLPGFPFGFSGRVEDSELARNCLNSRGSLRDHVE